MNISPIVLDPKYSTTSKLIQKPPKLQEQSSSKIKSTLFLPKNDKRFWEGGLRKKGYFKYSYNTNNFRNQEKNIQNFIPSLGKSKIIPLVTIITVVFNGEKHIEKTIKSVINQTYDNIEYIIIDGNSTDNTPLIIQKYEELIDYWFSEPDGGIYEAMNKGIQLATGDLIGIINCGDFYPREAISKVIELYLENLQSDNYLIISGAMIRFNEKRDIKFKTTKTLEQFKKNIHKKMEINHPSTFIEAKVYKDLGKFNSNFRICADYELIFRAYYSEVVQFIFTNDVLANMLLGGISETFIGFLLRCKERFLIRKQKVGFINNIILSGIWITNNLIKLTIKKICYKNILKKYYKIKHR